MDCRSGRRTSWNPSWPNGWCAMFPQVERVRFVSSGTEAAMSAIRLARGYTGRTKILKFEGCYHGTADSLLVKAGSGALAFGTPSSAGVPADLAQHTLVAQFNDLASVEQLFVPARQRHCLRDDRTDCRQHEPDQAGGRFSCRASRLVHEIRCLADFRRSHDRLSGLHSVVRRN